MKRLKRFLSDLLNSSAKHRRASVDYQWLHENEKAYQYNNWLLDELPFLSRTGANSLLEIGCGNGRFLEQAAVRFKQVAGIDLAKSPILAEILERHPKILFHQIDILKSKIPGDYDLIVSADVMEHLPPETLEEVMLKLDKFPMAFHKIACYDDGHSHLSIFGPEDWLLHFKKINKNYTLLRIEARRDDINQRVATIIKCLPPLGVYLANP